MSTRADYTYAYLWGVLVGKAESDLRLRASLLAALNAAGTYGVDTVDQDEAADVRAAARTAWDAADEDRATPRDRRPARNPRRVE